MIRAEQRLGEAKSELDRFDYARERQRARGTRRVLAEAAEQSLEIDDIQRALHHSGRVRETLDRFRSALLEAQLPAASPPWCKKVSGTCSGRRA